ncbi:MAG: hypothetical protein IJU13_09135 [Bacteroidales bacterium]|nr:hypothetical protein [Bacteroidales bacterium]
MIKNNIFDLNKGYLLFSEEEMNPRLNADRDDVLSTFSPLCDSIVAGIMEAGNEYLEYAEEHPVARQENTFPSSNLHGLIIEKMSRIPGIGLSRIHKRNSVLEIGPYKVWVKKLDDGGLPWVNETVSSLKRVYQKAEGDDIMPILILGYRLDQIERISSIQLIYIKGDRQLWAPIDLGSMAAANQFVRLAEPASDEPEVTVKPEKKKGKIAL